MGKKLYKKEVLLRVEAVHGKKFKILETDFDSVKQEIEIICPKHGTFTNSLFQLYNKKADCPKCSKEKQYFTRKTNKRRFIEKATSIHGKKYDYSLVEYKGYNNKVKIICPQHGVFEQTPYAHYITGGCLKCSRIKQGLNARITKEEFINKASEIHGCKYNYDKLQYHPENELIITCPEHGDFLQKAMNHMQGKGCMLCGRNNISENELAEFLEKFVPIIRNKRFKGIKELDIFIPSKNIAIEYNGLYWHSDKFVTKNYHLDKTLNCKKEGIRLIHIFEDEWIFKKEIVKSRLINILGLENNKIHARKCKISLISKEEEKEFLKNNHIQGYINSAIRLGLLYNGELVSVMTFSKLRNILGHKNKKNSYELLRFCNKINTFVVGGASKLFKFFTNNFNYEELISYADRRWSCGNLYEKLNFEFCGYTNPNYWYAKQNKRLHRSNFTKNRLVKSGFPKELTEKDIMNNNGYSRIYDCGNLKFIIKTK